MGLGSQRIDPAMRTPPSVTPGETANCAAELKRGGTAGEDPDRGADDDVGRNSASWPAGARLAISAAACKRGSRLSIQSAAAPRLPRQTCRPHDRRETIADRRRAGLAGSLASGQSVGRARQQLRLDHVAAQRRHLRLIGRPADQIRRQRTAAKQPLLPGNARPAVERGLVKRRTRCRIRKGFVERQCKRAKAVALDSTGRDSFDTTDFKSLTIVLRRLRSASACWAVAGGGAATRHRSTAMGRATLATWQPVAQLYHWPCSCSRHSCGNFRNRHR